MKLYLVQHAEAVSKDVDQDRPLSENGRIELQNLAEFFATSGVQITNIFHSGKTRARQSAEIIARTIAPNVVPGQLNAMSPNDDVVSFAREVMLWQHDTMLVGHLPFMSRLLSYLVVNDAEQEIVTYRPGTIVSLQRLDSGQWRVISMLRPDLIENQAFAGG